MTRTIFKTICIFTLVFFVMSMTAAACPYSCKTRTDAKDDTFTCKSKSCSYNVLKNDKGCNIKVTTTGTITTAQGGKVIMQSNGKFTYIKPASCGKSCTDSFKYTIKGKKGSDSAIVKIKCSSCSKCASICAKCPTCPSCISCRC